MNIVFSIIMIVSGFLILRDKPEIAVSILTESGTKAVELSLRLLAIYAVWMGILKICDDSGVTKALARALKPLIRLLFGNVSQETMGHISINMSANILGMGNAATPAAIKAIQSMFKDEYGTKLAKNKLAATFPMIMLLVLNATSLQLIPTSVISLRASFGSKNPSDILLPSFIASAISTVFGVLAIKILGRKKNG